MARLHTRFRKIHKKAVRAARDLFEATPWREDDEVKQTAYERFLRTASAAYGVPTPRLTVSADMDDEEEMRNEPNHIRMSKYSITTLFHCFRHHLQMVGAVEVDDGINPCTDAQAWACSLFYTVRPLMFRKRVREGRIAGVYPDDLLSSATLAARQDEVDEAFAGIIAESYEDDDIDNEDEMETRVVAGDLFGGAEDCEPEPDEDEDEIADVRAQDEADAAQGSMERVTVAEAARLHNVSESTIRNMCRDGRLDSVQDGRRVYVLMDRSAHL